MLSILRREHFLSATHISVGKVLQAVSPQAECLNNIIALLSYKLKKGEGGCGIYADSTR
jgi:hypothetical protein